MTDWESISSAISDATRRTFKLREAIPIGGGSINLTYRLDATNGARYFVKLSDAQRLPMFIAEAAGLAAHAETQTLNVPRPVTYGIAGRHSYLILEHLELVSRGNVRQLGERIAALHRCTEKNYGFAQDNFIGTTKQLNRWESDWPKFWREHRLGFQLRLAEQNGHGIELFALGELLMEALPLFFSSYTPQPSLLHGDLWGGNHAYLADGTPVIFDPAVYYGDRECDIAMTELFGGYPAEFYAAYQNAYPLDAGYALRRDLYNLYHILNHANLFGGGYAQQAKAMIQRLLAAVS